MSSATLTWVKTFKFTALGCEPAEDLQEYLKQDEYIKYFLAPMCFIASGLSKEEFDWDLANKGNFEAQNYLVKGVPSLVQPNSLIQYFNHLGIQYAWMYILPELVNYTKPYAEGASVSSIIRKAYDSYMETHEAVIGCFDMDGCDVTVIVDKATGKPISTYPENCIIYPDTVRAGIGTSLLKDAANKPYYRLAPIEYEILRQAEDAALLMPKYCKQVKVPYVTEEGAVAYRDVNWATEDKPPADVINLIASLPKSLIDECGDEIHALISMCDDENVTVSNEVRAWVSTVRMQLVDDFDEPLHQVVASEDIDESTVKNLESLGYNVQYMDDVILDFCKRFNISTDISVAQLIEFYNSPDDVVTPPTPTKASVVVDADAEKARELGVDEVFITQALSTQTSREDFWRQVATTYVESPLKQEEPLEKLVEPYSSFVPKDILESVESEIGHAACTSEEFLFTLISQMATKVNSGEPVKWEREQLAERIKHLPIPEDLVSSALSNVERQCSKDDFYTSIICTVIDVLDQNEIVPTSGKDITYLDKFEEAGARMLHLIRESILRDSSIENRAAMSNALYGYLRIMMCDANTEKDEVLAALQERANSAQPAGKAIILEGIRIINEN